MATKRSDECYYPGCHRRRCLTRIWTPTSPRGIAPFDEVACGEHSRDLERHADLVLKGAPRINASANYPLRRGSHLVPQGQQV